MQQRTRTAPPRRPGPSSRRRRPCSSGRRRRVRRHNAGNRGRCPRPEPRGRPEGRRHRGPRHSVRSTRPHARLAVGRWGSVRRSVAWRSVRSAIPWRDVGRSRTPSRRPMDQERAAGEERPSARCIGPVGSAPQALSRSRCSRRWRRWWSSRRTGPAAGAGHGCRTASTRSPAGRRRSGPGRRTSRRRFRHRRCRP